MADAMTDTTTEAVQRVLDGVTPGPWHEENGDVCVDGLDYPIAMVGCDHAAAARFIAWCREGVPALAADRDAAVARADAAEAQVSELRVALEPLAAMAERYDPDEGDDGHLECWSGLAVPKIHHLRTARAVLAKGGA